MDMTPLKRNKALRRYLRTQLLGHFNKRQKRRLMRELRREIHVSDEKLGYYVSYKPYEQRSSH